MGRVLPKIYGVAAHAEKTADLKLKSLIDRSADAFHPIAYFNTIRLAQIPTRGTNRCDSHIFTPFLPPFYYTGAGRAIPPRKEITHAQRKTS